MLAAYWFDNREAFSPDARHTPMAVERSATARATEDT